MYKFLQYNTDNLRHGNEYLQKVFTGVDYALLQRYPMSKKSELSGLIDGRVYIDASTGHKDALGVVVARHKRMNPFSGQTTIELPSKTHVNTIEDIWQGSVATATKVGNVNLCSVLPCFNFPGEFPLTNDDTLKDIEFLLEELKDSKNIIAGDFHNAPGSFSKLDELIQDYGYTSYLDDYETFANGGKNINLDRLISNVPNLKVEDVIVHDIETDRGHFAITYNLEFDK
jgi:hypothetical protein